MPDKLIDDSFKGHSLIEFLLSEAGKHGVAPRQIALELLEGATEDIGRIRTGVVCEGGKPPPS